MKPRTFWILATLLVLIPGLLWALTEITLEDGNPVICKWCWIGGHHHHRGEMRSAATTLKTFSTAEADFRANDRDWDQVNQFWRGDVAGLYVIVPRNGRPKSQDHPGDAIKLIELSAAAADDRPATADLNQYAVRSAKGGYWFRAIRHADEDPKALDPQRFAFCAFPDTPSAGKYIFIIDENNAIYRAETKGRRGIELFPGPEELKTSWARVD